jgi:hypothetical protein
MRDSYLRDFHVANNGLAISGGATAPSAALP